jgi:DNA adenine methylase
VKPPLSFYGGKQRIASKIVPYIHEIPHTVYVEPFCGGASVLFEKGYPSVTNNDHYREVINDLNEALITFYRVGKTRPDELNTKIQATLHSRADYKKACNIVKDYEEHDELSIAWAVWVGFNQSFAYRIGGGWSIGCDSENHSHTTQNKKLRLPEQLKRLEQTYIECDDALKIIKRWDSPNTLFYCDPPYINTNLGHYHGYTENDYKDLLEALSSIQGSFILSGYPNDLTPKEWRYVDFTAQMSAANGKHREKLDTTRIERLWIKDNSKDESEPLSFDVNKQESLFL